MTINLGTMIVQPEQCLADADETSEIDLQRDIDNGKGVRILGLKVPMGAYRAFSGKFPPGNYEHRRPGRHSAKN